MADDRVDMGWRAIGAFLKKWRQKRRKKKDGIGSAAKEPEMWVENPYLPQFRNIMEQVLKKRGISYRDFAPVCIDEEKPELLLMEEDIVTVLHELERDLNALTILTERPDFFSSYAARMEEEYGLMVSVREKRHAGAESPFLFPGNVILEFERNGHFCTPEKTGGYCYIPIYKIPWQSGENLDILVPIGYNTVIVKGLDLREESGSSKDVFAGFSEQ